MISDHASENVSKQPYIYPVVERFISINGEGTKAGELAAFIRLRQCNLACNYCDTSWANTKSCFAEELSAQELLDWLLKEQIKNVTLTGGEPLLTPHVDELIYQLGEAGFVVEIETNGSIPLKDFSKITYRPVFTMDYKCPDSGMEKHMCCDNFHILSRRDTVKFVVSSRTDLNKAYEISRSYDLVRRCHVYLSPVFGRIDPKDIVSFMQEMHWNGARLQLQMHKFIWPPEQRGV